MLKEQYIGLVEICKSWQSWPQICSMNKAEELKAKHMNPCWKRCHYQIFTKFSMITH